MMRAHWILQKHLESNKIVKVYTNEMKNLYKSLLLFCFVVFALPVATTIAHSQPRVVSITAGDTSFELYTAITGIGRATTTARISTVRASGIRSADGAQSIDNSNFPSLEATASIIDTKSPTVTLTSISRNRSIESTDEFSEQTA